MRKNTIARKPGAWVHVALLSLLGTFSTLGHGWSETTAPRSPPPLSVDQIDAKIEQLTAGFRDADLVAKRGDTIREAIASGDFAVADRELNALSGQSDPKAWASSALTLAMDRFWLDADGGYSARLAAWAAANPTDPWPLLLQARRDSDWAWRSRGGNFAKDVDPAAMADFSRFLERGLAEIDAAIKLDDRDPYFELVRLRLLQSEGASDEMDQAFESAVAKFPNSLPLYESMLLALEPKWGGDIDYMYGLVEHYAGGAADDSPLKMLYISLYANLIDTAGITCYRFWSDPEKMDACVAGEMQRIVKAGLEDKVVQGLDLYDRTDKAQYTSWLGHVLSPMVTNAYSSRYPGAVLELAAKSTRSQTETDADPAHPNNYVIDYVVAQALSKQKLDEMAEQKYRVAIEDLRGSTFLPPPLKAKEAAAIYLTLAWTYNKMHRLPEVVAYESAALALDGSNNWQYLVCQGYFDLKRYDDVIRACSGRSLFEREPEARYYCGRAYYESGKIDEALGEFTAVANAWGDSRGSAVGLAARILLIDKKDYRGGIEFLKKYKYLYDPKITKSMDTAIAFNDLCYAYMQLGEDSDALDNCAKSLKFASLPDAYAKQLALAARMGSKGESKPQDH
jgi:hypothetical protein